MKVFLYKDYFQKQLGEAQEIEALELENRHHTYEKIEVMDVWPLRNNQTLCVSVKVTPLAQLEEPDFTLVLIGANLPEMANCMLNGVPGFATWLRRYVIDRFEQIEIDRVLRLDEEERELQLLNDDSRLQY